EVEYPAAGGDPVLDDFQIGAHVDSLYGDAVHVTAEGLQVARDRNQERIVALRRVDFQVADVLAGRHQRVDDFLRTLRREAPVGSEGDHAEVGLGGCQRRGQVVLVGGGRVEVIQRLGHQQVGIGIETAGKLFALVAQVALDLEFHAVEIVIELLALETAAELGAHGVIGQVGDVPYHARQHQPAPG